MSGDEETEPARSTSGDSVDEQKTDPAGSLPRSAASADSFTAPGIADLAEFSSSLIDLGIITPEELASHAATNQEGVVGLSRTLVEAGKLTPYQAAAVYQKKTRGLLVGNYIILDKIGQGGMGMVFKCRHRRLGRAGALKILPPSFARDRQALLRFRREVEAAGRLKHPNVVSAFDADEDRGVHFLVMEYVEGRDLDRVVRELGPMPVSQAIDCIIQAAHGLEAAHAQGIIHRDIKPGNLMLDAAGTVRVLDLGLARIVDASNPFGKSPGARLTESGMYMGTVDFMAPEQAEDSHRADHRADVYALGCTLYYLLTGQAPFGGPTVLKRLMAHLEQPAPSLRSKRPGIPASLDTAFQKMLAKRPEDRPQSMTELIALLETCTAEAVTEASATAPPKLRPELIVFDQKPFNTPAVKVEARELSIALRVTEREGLLTAHDFNLEDLNIDVRSDPKSEPLLLSERARARFKPLSRPALRTLIRRLPRNSGLMAAAGAVGVLAALLVWLVFFRDHRGTTGAELVLGPAGTDQSRPPNKNQLARTSVVEASAPTFQDEFHTIFDGKSPSGWMLCNKAPLPRSHVQKDGINPSGTGSYLVVYQEKLSDFVLECDYKLSKGCNSGVFLRVSDLTDPVRTGIEVALDDTKGQGFTDSGAFYGLVAPEVNAQRPAGKWNQMTITAQGPEITVVLNGSLVSSINLDEWTVPGKRPDGLNHTFKNVAISTLARTGYVGFQNLRGNCWFNQIRLKKLSPGGVSTPKLTASTASPPPRASESATLVPYVETARFTGHTHPWVETIRLSPDGKTLLTAGGDRTARLWDIASGRELRRLWHPAGLRPAAFHPDGRRALTGCSDGLVRLWNLETGRLIRPVAKRPGPVTTLAVSSDGLYALAGGENNDLRLLEIETGNPVVQYEGISTPIWSAAISPDGRRVLAGGASGTIFVGDTKSRDRLQTLSLHTQTVWDLAFFPDARHGISAGRDGMLVYWDLDARSALKQAKLGDSSIRCLAIASDYRNVIFGGQHSESRDQGSLGVWDLTSDRPPTVFPQRFAHLSLVCLPQGAIATADDGGIARIWEPDAAISQARELSEVGKRREALDAYDTLLAARRVNARLLIERGRLLARLGEASRADADFQAAARLAPENPELFLDAGWWVAGPYPANFDQAASFERSPAPDPSRTAPATGSETHHWYDAETAMQGLVDFGEFFKVEHGVAYAMTIVYSTRPRDVVLLIGNDDAARIWNNGSQVYESQVFSPPDSHAVMIHLQSGRNTILAKVANERVAHTLSLRFGTTALDTARALAEAKKWKEAAGEFATQFAREPDCSDPRALGSFGESLVQLKRWKEATPVFEKIASLDSSNLDKQMDLLKCYLVTKDYALYRRTCEAVIAQFGKGPNTAVANNAIWQVVLVPSAVRNFTEVVEIGRKLASSRTAAGNDWNTFGAVLYRAGQYPSSLAFLKKSIDARKGKGNGLDWVFTAMARHHSRQRGARDALARARELARDSAQSWQSRIELNTLIEEAEDDLKLPPRQ
jgi:serine/threonine protein kinase/WD40 repeat protein/tetratricopeptide (TPR) repeat protein